MRNFFINLSIVFCTLLFIAIGLEIILRFMPVNQGLGFIPVNDENPTFRAAPNRTVQFAKKWNFVLANKKHINNAGFVNQHDYTQEGLPPLVAVVGDSYVEALQVTDDEPYFERLLQENPGVRVYSFGFSGAGLSQYLAWIKFAHEQYRNDFLIVNVVGNDFDESLKKYKFQGGFHHYDFDSQGRLFLVRKDWQPSLLGKLVTFSALARYLIYHLQVLDTVQMLKQRFVSPQEFLGNTAESVDYEKEQDSYKAVDAFLRDLPDYSGLSYEKVLFVIDAERSVVYDSSREHLKRSQNSYVHKMSVYLKKKAEQLGCSVIESVQVFEEDYKQHQQRFEFVKEGDWHWNVRGHQVIANAIQNSDWWKMVLQSRAIQ